MVSKNTSLGVSYELILPTSQMERMPATVEEGLKEYETGVTYEPFFALSQMEDG